MMGKYPIPQDRDPISQWRVYLPSDIDRDVYIRNCYRSGTVTLIDQWNEIQHRVRIGKLALQQVRFPKDSKDKGSEVLCNSAPYSGQLYVVEVYSSPDEFIDQEEENYRLVKSINGGSAEVRVDGNGRILLTVDSEEDAEVIISITDKNKAGKLTVNISGEANLVTSKSVTITSPKIFLNESSEPILLGNKVKEFLSKWLDKLGQESAGPYPLRNQSFYKNLKKELDDLLSKLSFVK